MRHLSIFAVLALTASSAACAGKTTETPADQSNPGNVTPDGDSGAMGDDTGTASTEAGADTGTPVDMTPPSDTYPAFKPWMAQLLNNGGPILAKPEIVTITWTGETNADTYEAFGDALGDSAYWKTLVSEYGVGAAVSGPTRHLRLTDAAPASLSDKDIDAFVAKNAADSMSGWPAPTDQTIYVMYIPQATNVSVSGRDACTSGVGGYHNSTDVGGKQISYAVVMQCKEFGTLPDEATISASHEIAEASTDPQPMVQPGWVDFDHNHLAGMLFQQFAAENGDACEFYQSSQYKETEPSFSYEVQRQWSNASGAAGHDPCVPAPAGAYFNVTPLDLENVTADLSQLGGSTKTKVQGYKALVGETKTFTVGFYSDAKTDPWTIKVYEGNPVLGSGGGGGGSTTKRLELSVDKTTGQNGEKAHITVKVNAVGRTKTELVTVVSTQGTRKTVMPILIGSQ
ncbi:MAG: hypothetical protein ACXWVM_30925 [Polyangiales bacterium]